MRKNFRSIIVGLSLLFALCVATHAQAPIWPQSTTPSYSPTSVFTLATPFTAASQTQATSFVVVGGGSGIIQINAVALTTVTWEIEGSIDGGTTWQILPTAAFPTTALPSTLAASQTTTVAGTRYLVNIAGFGNIRFVTTSGTFTATSVTPILAAARTHGLL